MNFTLPIFLASCVLYNIGRDLNEPIPPLPERISSEEFDRIMAESFERTPANISDQNSYVRDQVVTRFFARHVPT